VPFDVLAVDTDPYLRIHNGLTQVNDCTGVLAYLCFRLHVLLPSRKHVRHGLEDGLQLIDRRPEGLGRFHQIRRPQVVIRDPGPLVTEHRHHEAHPIRLLAYGTADPAAGSESFVGKGLNAPQCGEVERKHRKVQRGARRHDRSLNSCLCLHTSLRVLIHD